jgi:hypothetical protein
MGQFNWFWPVWSESQKQQREDAKNSNFWRMILKKCTAEIPCAKKIKTKCLSRWDRTAKEKELRKRKVLRALHPSHFCMEVTKNIFLAARVTQRPVTRKLLRELSKRQTATGHKNKKLRTRQ